VSAALLALLLAALQPRYEARVLTYGCNSTAEMRELRRLRGDPRAFKEHLIRQTAYGQCIGIGQGTVVEGTIEAADSTVLRIEARQSPPGYMAPAEDFRLLD
jgi:hypothetical protein